MTDNPKKTVQIGIRISPALRARLQRLADWRGMTLSAFVRKLLSDDADELERLELERDNGWKRP